MVDIMTPKQRSHCMSQVRGKNTKPEMMLRKVLWQKGLRYRLHYKLPGKPDIAFVAARIAVFVDGCFWHGCPQHGAIPETNRQSWETKIQGNIDRDKRVNNELESSGWKVLRFWEHEIKKDLNHVVSCIEENFKPTSS